MKKKIIIALTALSVLAFPMSSLAANRTSAPTYAYAASGCHANGTHGHDMYGYHNGNGRYGSYQNWGRGMHRQ